MEQTPAPRGPPTADLGATRAQAEVTRLPGGEVTRLDDEDRTTLLPPELPTIPPRHAAPSPPAPAQTLQEVLEHQGVLGQGGMGVVYRVRDRRLDRPAALKLLIDPQPHLVQRFRREAEITARLDHPSIPPVYESGVDGEGRHYLLMRLIEGRPLSTLIRELHEEADPLHPTRVSPLLEALVKVAEALAYAHSRGVVHRDVKPDNVMVGRFGEVLLMDWGIAGPAGQADALPDSPRPVVAPGQTIPGQVMGTPGYMSPQQADGEASDPRSDVFSLGAVLVAILTGRKPVDGETPQNLIVATLAGRVELPRQRRGDVPPELDAIAARALELEARDRYRAAEDLANDLRAYLRGERVEAYRYSAWERLLRGVRRHPAWVVAAAAAGLLALAGLWVMQVRAQADVRAEQARLRSEAETRAELARGAGDHARGALESLKGVDDTGRATGAALTALEGASRWHALAPTDPAAAQAKFDAALALGQVALDTEQWDLAREAFAQADGLGVDDARARAEQGRVDELRGREAQRRRKEIEGWLEQARSGALAQRPDGRLDAVFAITRYSEPQTVELLAAELDRVSGALLVAAGRELYARTQGMTWVESQREQLASVLASQEIPDPPPLTVAERAQLGGLSAGLGRAAQRGGVDVAGPLQRAQLQAVGEPGFLAARVAAEALGRLGLRAGAVEALGRYLQVETSELRALPMGLALCRLGGPQAERALFAARDRFGINGEFWRQVEPLLAQETQANPAAASAAPREVAPGDAQALIDRASERTSKGDLRGAVDDYTAALALRPDDPHLLVDRASVRDDLGEVKEALADLTRATELDPELTFAWMNRGVVYFDQGQMQQALADFEQAIAVSPQPPAPAFFNRGNAKAALGDLAGAEADFRSALERDPSFAEAWQNLAQTQLSLGRDAEAERAADRALALNERLGAAWSVRGQVRLHREELAPALSDLTRASELRPKDGATWLLLGDVRKRAGELDGAFQAYARALELDPHCATKVYTAQGQIYLQQGRLEEAEALYTRALQGSHPDPWLYNARAGVRDQLGDSSGALEDIDRAVQLAPQDGSLRYNHGNALVRAGRMQEAVADFQRAVELSPSLPEAWINLGLGLATLKRNAEAIAAYERALQVAPDHPRADFVRQELKRLRGGEAPRETE